MATKLKIPTVLQHLTAGKEIIELDGSTVRECLNDLIRQYPNTREWFDPKNPSTWIVLNQELVHFNEMDKPVTAGDELTLVLIIGAG